MVFGNDNRAKKKTRLCGCKCLFEDVPIPLKTKEREREKPPFSFFPSNILDRTRRTIISSHSRSAHQPVFTLYCGCILFEASRGAWRPGAAKPSSRANRPVLLKLHRSHLQSSYRNEQSLAELAFNHSCACRNYS